MAAKRVVRHRILDLAATIFVIAIITTLRSALLPTGDETMPNTPTPVGELLQSLQGTMPTLAAILWGITLFIAALDAGRFGPKYSLYPAYTLMAIPIFGVIAGGVMVSSDYLLSTVAMVVMLLGTKYLIRCIMRTDSFNDLSLAMLYYGTLPLIIAPTALLYVALPILVLMVRSTWRDWVVAVSSLLFPLAAVCYWNWCAGNGFLAVAENIYSSMFTASEFSFFSTLSVAGIVLLGIIIIMVICAVTLIISEKYSIKIKSRAVMRFNAMMLLCMVSMFFLPSATASLFALVAVPASMLIPLIFVRMGVGFTEMLYRLMLVAAAANMVIMCL